MAIPVMIRTTLLFALLLSFLCPTTSGASTEYTVETVPNVRLSDRYNHVSNPDAIIRPDDVAQINRLLQTIEDSLGIEVAVVAVESIGDHDARMFATDLFQHWGLGKKGEDNGLLIQLVTEPRQRSVVFETGYGIEGVLPDAICYRLQQQYMLPDFKAGDYSRGMLKGVEAVARYLMASDYERASMVMEQPDSGYDSGLGGFIGFFATIGIFLFIVFMALYMQWRRRRPRTCPCCGKKTLVYVQQRVVQRATYQSGGIVEEVWQCKNCGYIEKKNRHTSRLHRSSGPVIFGSGPTLGGGRLGGLGRGGSWGGGRSGGGGAMSRW